MSYPSSQPAPSISPSSMTASSRSSWWTRRRRIDSGRWLDPTSQLTTTVARARKDLGGDRPGHRSPPDEGSAARRIHRPATLPSAASDRWHRRRGRRGAHLGPTSIHGQDHASAMLHCDLHDLAALLRRDVDESQADVESARPQALRPGHLRLQLQRLVEFE